METLAKRQVFGSIQLKRGVGVAALTALIGLYSPFAGSQEVILDEESPQEAVFPIAAPAPTSTQTDSLLQEEVSSVTRGFASDLTSELVLTLYKSGILELQENPSRVSVGNDSIADIVILRGNQVHVLGKALGSTNVVFWDQFERIFATVNIEVTHDLASLKKKLFQMMPDEKIRVYSAQENLVLEGNVSSATNLSAALKVAAAYLPECISSGGGQNANSVAGNEGESNQESCEKAEVVNLMSVVGSQQVMLEVKVAEISRTFRRTWDPQLNFIDFTNPTRFGTVTNGASFPDVPSGAADGTAPIIGPVVNEFAPTTPSIGGFGLFFSDLTGDTLFSAAIQIEKENGLAKILAEPNITTLTGRTAEFHSGGEFPIVTSTFQGTTVEYQDFGVSVKFLPTILGDTINLDLDVEVSEIDQTQEATISSDDGVSASFAFPFLTTRSIRNTVELTNGQTLGIAGLIQDDVDQILTRLPGVGDIPVIGSLFRSQEYLSGQTELVIFVTPHLAKPISPDKIRLPTDSFVPPNDFEFYVLGRMESLQEPAAINRRRNLEGGFDGVTFGHDL